VGERGGEEVGGRFSLFVQQTTPDESSFQVAFHTASSQPDGGDLYVLVGGAMALIRVAAEGETQGGTHLPHSLWSEVRQTPAQALLRHGNRVVEIHRAWALQTVFFVQPHF
jgi:hypothetical protein